MSYVIRWLHEAEMTMIQNMDYLAANWDNKVQYQFFSDVESALLKLKEDPQLYPLYRPESNIRKYKINKRVILYFRVIDSTTIELMTFWNTYRDPKNLKL